mgnify:CR=1 FL=1
MTRYVKTLSYVFAAMAGVCFVSGLAVLSEGSAANHTKRKRHLVGGVLMSVSLFFGGLAFTMMTIKGEETNEKTDA